jgi:hypothetical protein
VTFQQIAEFIRKTYPTATHVGFEVTHGQMVMRVVHNEPHAFNDVTTLDGTHLSMDASDKSGE